MDAFITELLKERSTRRWRGRAPFLKIFRLSPYLGGFELAMSLEASGVIKIGLFSGTGICALRAKKKSKK